MQVTVRPLERSDWEAARELQELTWGRGFVELVPPALLMISRELGGVATGAFDTTDRLVGMVYGLTGLRRREMVHWSHLLAVHPEQRGRGLGRRLKLEQRRALLELGVTTVLWTFDPLEARNAHLNLEGLGAVPEAYLRNVYGDGATSSLHRGLGTDRFRVRWCLEDADVAACVDRRRPRPPIAWQRSPRVNTTEGGEPLPAPFELPGSPVVRIEIPDDVQALKASDPAAARAFREATRYALESYLARDYRVRRLLRQSADSRTFYILTACNVK